MKKIVGIIAAAAMAASVFAVDLASMVQLDGDLMGYDTATKTFKALNLKDYDPQGTSDFVWKMSVSGDQAGGEIWTYSTGDKNAVGFNNLAADAKATLYTIWFKPIDSLKVTVGSMDLTSCWNPQFGWWAKNADWAHYGYAVNFAKDNLSINAAVSSERTHTDYKTYKGMYFFDSSKDGYDKVAPFWFDASYGLSAGKAQVYVAKGAAIHPHGFTGWNASDLAVGAVWGNNPYMQTGYFVDAAVTFANKPWIGAGWQKADGFVFEKFVSQIYGQWFSNGIGVQLINTLAYVNEVWDGNSDWSDIEKKSDKEFKYGFELKASYAVGAYTPYIQINGYDIMDKKMTVDLGATTSVGACSIMAQVEIPVEFASTYKFSFTVPVEFTINL